jgi:hypothetical protein
MTTHGGARPNTKRRPDDGRIHNRNRSGKGGRKGWRIWARLGENEFIFEVGRRNEAEAIKAFAEQIGYEVRIEKITADAIIL